MAISIISPSASFIRFNVPVEEHCIFGEVDFELPVVYANDHSFQWIMQGSTEGEANSLFSATVRVGLVRDCDDASFAIEFGQTYNRSKLAPTQVLYNWGSGYPGFTSVIGVGECFHFRIELNGVTWCSNVMKRFAVNDPEVCWQSVIDYSNSNGAGFGFFSCGPGTGLGSGGDDGDEDSANCLPTVITFTNVPTVSVPYTAEMIDKYGEVPTVQVWIYDTNGALVNMGVQAQLLGSPINQIFVDNGGPGSGKIRIS